MKEQSDDKRFAQLADDGVEVKCHACGFVLGLRKPVRRSTSPDGRKGVSGFFLVRLVLGFSFDRKKFHMSKRAYERLKAERHPVNRRGNLEPNHLGKQRTGVYVAAHGDPTKSPPTTIVWCPECQWKSEKNETTEDKMQRENEMVNRLNRDTLRLDNRLRCGKIE